MLSYLSEFTDVFGPLNLFRYITFRGMGAAATAMVIGFLIAPAVFGRLRALKMAQTLRTEAEVGALAKKHASKGDTPTMGGLQIFIAVTASALLWAKPNIYVLTALLAYVVLTGIGFLDDYLKVTKKSSGGLKGRYKLIAQAALTGVILTILLLNEETALSVRELWAPFFKEPLLVAMPLPFLFAFFFLVLGGSSNAINLTDGVDGLAIGCTITVALIYAIMAYAAGNVIIAEYLFISYLPGTGELAIVCAALVGGSMAFLWYNAHPAEVFMGDTGSLALGGLIGTIAFLVHQPLTLIIVGGMFVLEALSVIIQIGSFKMTGKRVFRMAPLHHHFELSDWAETKVVIRFWILSLGFALAGLATLKLR